MEALNSSLSFNTYTRMTISPICFMCDTPFTIVGTEPDGCPRAKCKNPQCEHYNELVVCYIDHNKEWSYESLSEEEQHE